MYYFVVAVFFALFAAIMIGGGALILFETFATAPLTDTPLLPDAHPVVKIGSSLVLFLVGFLLLMYMIELYRTSARTRLLIAPEGFIYTSNGGCMWSSWNNAVRIERLFVHSSWQEGIMLREPANIAGRTLGFSIFSIWVFPWNRFIPLTPFGALWRMSVANRKGIEEFRQVAQKLVPADHIPSVTPTEGALYHDIRRYAEHLFTSE